MKGTLDETPAGAMTARVTAALSRSRARDPERYTKLFEVRSIAAGGHGSVYALLPKEIEAKVEQTTWQAYAHPAVTPPCIAAVAKLPGFLGIVPIVGLPADTKFTCIDHKNDGYCELLLEGESPRRAVNFTTIILGPDDDGADVVYTLHPGDPIVPSELHGLEKGELRKGDIVTLAYALERGFTYAKMV